MKSMKSQLFEVFKVRYKASSPRNGTSLRIFPFICQDNQMETYVWGLVRNALAHLDNKTGYFRKVFTRSGNSYFSYLNCLFKSSNNDPFLCYPISLYSRNASFNTYKLLSVYWMDIRGERYAWIKPKNFYDCNFSSTHKHKTSS
ncbi:hypothetical protein Tcan_00528, partial [Toxocara canis]